uniref:Uncharacterized protein n=1 Tax=Panagrolaimus sp. JU765 TaxID=591449 RepID=A0AC34QJ77_9BILA
MVYSYHRPTPSTTINDSSPFIDNVDHVDCNHVFGGSHHHQPHINSSQLQYLPMSVSVECINEELLALDDPNNYRCCCGLCHVVLATKLFLIFYVCITICGLIFGMMSAFVWIFIPFLVTTMTLYGFWQQKHKYLYPFLIISVVQLIVCLVMALVVVTFSIVNYDTLKVIIAYSTQSEPSAYTVVIAVGATVCGCCIMAIIHVWQSVIIYGCLQYYEFVYRRDQQTISLATGCPTLYENKYRVSMAPETFSRPVV